MTIEPFELQKMLTQAAEIGATAAMSKYGILKPYLSIAEAYRIYGRGNVDRWLKEKLIKRINDGEGTKIRLNRVELEIVAKTSNRLSYHRNKYPEINK